jgi:c-di-GMP-binding flagellar brake protein YcgR
MKQKPTSINERRRYIRTDKLLPMTISLKEEKSYRDIHATTRNISATGTMAETTEKLAVGSTVKLEISIPGAANPVHGNGTVVWSTPISGAGKYYNGIEFVGIEEDNKNTFLKFLCDAIYRVSTGE